MMKKFIRYMILNEVYSMTDKTSVIFGNPIDKKTIKKANKSKLKFQKKYGDDSNKDYKLGFEAIPTLDFMGCKNLVFKDKVEPLGEKPLIDKLCELVGVPASNIDNSHFHKDRSKSFDRYASLTRRI